MKVVSYNLVTRLSHDIAEDVWWIVHDGITVQMMNIDTMVAAIQIIDNTRDKIIQKY